jgi:hypothetical protein
VAEREPEGAREIGLGRGEKGFASLFLFFFSFSLFDFLGGISGCEPVAGVQVWATAHWARSSTLPASATVAGCVW